MAPTGSLQILEEEPGLVSYSKPLVGTSALHAAAAAGRADILQELLTALDAALHNKSVASASRAKRKVVNQRNLHGQTPLMLACKTGAPACVRALLRAGADPTLFDSLSQSTCLHYAARYGWPDVVDELLGDGSWAVSPGDGRRVHLREAVLVDSQGSHKYVDGRAALGLAPLHWSAAHGHVEVTQALIKWGANVSARCNLFLEQGQGPWVPYSTPLHLAAAKGDYLTTLALLSGWAQQAQQQGRHTGPDPRTVHDFWDRRPVDVARTAGHMGVLVLLSPATSLVQIVEPRHTVPALTMLAAKALRRKLSKDLDTILAEQAQQAGQRQQQAWQQAQQQQQAGQQVQQAQQQPSRCASLTLSEAPSCQRCPVCLGEGSSHGPSRQASRALPEDDGELHMQGWQLVSASACGHALCLACAKQLCRQRTGRVAVRCPCCRALVEAWVPAASTVPVKA
ncbi:hypothetical protein N2152v2_010516 [Parachlorella kessleri]